MAARIITSLLGIWLMAAPGLLDFKKIIANNGQIVGPLIASFALIAIWECTRNVRFANVLLGGWLLFAPWLLQYDNSTAFASDYVTGIAVILLSFIPPKRKDTFAGGWSSLWTSSQD